MKNSQFHRTKRARLLTAIRTRLRERGRADANCESERYAATPTARAVAGQRRPTPFPAG